MKIVIALLLAAVTVAWLTWRDRRGDESAAPMNWVLAVQVTFVFWCSYAGAWDILTFFGRLMQSGWIAAR